MAILSLDQLVAAMLPSTDVVKASFTGEAAGSYHSSWFLAGIPGAGAITSSGLNGTALNGPSIVGQIPFPAAVTGKNIYLARMGAVQGGFIGSVTLVDRLWANNGLVVTTTTAQTFTTPTWDRDNIFDGSFTGNGVQVGLEVSTATTGAAFTNGSMSYTNDAGTAGRTGTLNTFPATAALGTFVTFNLAAGDTGVRSIQSVTLGTTLVAGAVSVVAFRQVVGLGVPVLGVLASQDAISLGMQRLHDQSVPFLLFTLTGTVCGVTDVGITWAQG